MVTTQQMTSADPIWQQIQACNAVISELNAAIATNGQFSTLQLSGQSEISLLACGFTASDTNTMLTGFISFLNSKITTLTASLTAI